MNCKGCPFLVDFEDYDHLCTLGFRVYTDDFANMDDGNEEPYTDNCKLEIVTYALKDKRDSINFIPRDNGTEK